MLWLWAPITIVAAFLQNLRSVMQKSISDRLSFGGAAYARFFYAWPFSLLFVFGLHSFGGYEIPQLHGSFLFYCLFGGLTQILFTVVLLWMFSFRSFAVGTTFSKLEVIIIALLGVFITGDYIGPFVILAIVIGSIGTMVLAFTEAQISFQGLMRGMTEKATLIGLLSALLLGFSVVCFRAAALSLNEPHFIMAAAYTLLVVLILQTIIMGLWFSLFDFAQLKKVISEWRRAAPVGLVGMVCSLCWFIAFTIENAAYVRALGQVELIFSLLAGLFIFQEKPRLIELFAITLIIISIILILLAH